MSNPCRYTEQLGAYLDGELSRARCDDLKAHLSGCPECRRMLETLRRNDDLIREMPALELSADFDRAFWRKVDALEKDGRRPSMIRNLFGGWRPVWIGAMAGLAAAVVITLNSADPLTPEEVFIAEHMELLDELDLIGQLEMLERLDAIDAKKAQT